MRLQEIQIDQIPASALAIVSALRTHGKRALLVGGCVRDLLLGLNPKDFDICCDASHEELLQIFPHAKPVGAHFGVVLFDGIEIASFRSDGAYSDHRRPDSVQLVTDPFEDSCRRDLTINSMMFDPASGELLDFHGGRRDLEDGVIRTVGNPTTRFHDEDRLRMLRAVRFAARFGFKLAVTVMDAIRKHAHTVPTISIERIREELFKMLDQPNAVAAVRLLTATGLMPFVLPKFHQLSEDKQRLSLEVLLHVRTGERTAVFSLAILFSQLTLDEAAATMRHLKLDNDDVRTIKNILEMQAEIHRVSPDDTPATFKRLIRRDDFLAAFRLYEMRRQVCDPATGGRAQITALIDRMKLYTPEDLRPVPLITGMDLIQLGMQPGPRFKEILTAIETELLDGNLTTKDEALHLVSTL